MKDFILKFLPVVVTVGGSIFTFYQNFIILEQDVQVIKTEVARLDSEVLRLRDGQDHQNAAILDRLDVIVDSTNRPSKRR